MSRTARTLTQRQPRDSGVSLLELVVVLTILAAVLAMSVPYFRGSSRAVPLQPLAMRMVADLRMARTTGMAQNRPVKVTIDTVARSYVIDTGPRPVVLPRSVTVSVSHLGGAQPTGDTSVIVFYPDGSATGGHLFLSDQRRTVKVVIDAMMGAVTTETAEQ